MAIYGHMGCTSGSARHIYLKREFEVLLDAIAAEVSNSRLGPYGVSRSQLINKAIENFIEECRNDSTLKAAVEKGERKLSDEATRKQKKEVVLSLRVLEK